MSKPPKKSPDQPSLPLASTSHSVTGLVRRRRGRPARISRELIIQKSLEILATTEVQDFMVKSVAHELGTASMAIYNYFDSREDLLIAIADHVWLLFKAPKPKATWQGTLLAWLWAVKKHADLYPAITSLVGVDGRISSGWMAITAPISVLLHDQVGLRGKQLALATYLFVSNTMAMIRVVSQAAYRKTGESWRSEEIGLDDRQLEVFKKINLAALKEKEILDALFAQLIRGIEVFL